MSKGFNNWAYDHRIWYNAGRVRVKSWRKIEKAYEYAIDTLKKIEKFWIEEKSGMSKWCFKTKTLAFARLKKFWITISMLTSKLESKWIKNLQKFL
jgi:hypothetical protein